MCAVLVSIGTPLEKRRMISGLSILSCELMPLVVMPESVSDGCHGDVWMAIVV